MVLGLFWACSGVVLGLFWGSLGLVLGLFWGCPQPQPQPYRSIPVHGSTVYALGILGTLDASWVHPPVQRASESFGELQRAPIDDIEKLIQKLQIFENISEIMQAFSKGQGIRRKAWEAGV